MKYNKQTKGKLFLTSAYDKLVEKGAGEKFYTGNIHIIYTFITYTVADHLLVFICGYQTKKKNSCDIVKKKCFAMIDTFICYFLAEHK